MNTPRRPLLNGAIVFVVLLFLGLAAALVVDSVQTTHQYDALAAHRVRVTERTQLCLGRGVCQINYVYRGTHFSAIMRTGQATAYLVDPQNPSIRMSAFDFDGGPPGTTVDDVFAAILILGALTLSTMQVVRLYRRRTTPDGEPEPSKWSVPLDPEDDPVVKPFTGPEPPEPGVVPPGSYLRLLPGEHLDVIEDLPFHHPDRIQMCLGNGELVTDTPHQRHTYRVQATASHGTGVQVRRLVVVYTRHRASGHVNHPDRFLVLLDDRGRTVGRLDFSDTWEMSTTALQRICRDAGITFSMERYESDRELLKARPQWISPEPELALEHPMAADARDFGMSLWIGTGIALGLLGATGMELVFATPVRFVVLTLALAGLITALVISVWGRFAWRKRAQSSGSVPKSK